VSALAALTLALGATVLVTGGAQSPGGAQTNGRYWSAPQHAATADGLLGR